MGNCTSQSKKQQKKKRFNIEGQYLERDTNRKTTLDQKFEKDFNNKTQYEYYYVKSTQATLEQNQQKSDKNMGYSGSSMGRSGRKSSYQGKIIKLPVQQKEKRRFSDFDKQVYEVNRVKLPHHYNN